jgi:hypothetical protein
MKPITPQTWRKTLRAESKGTYHRHERTVETEQPRKGSTWYRRHKWQLAGRKSWREGDMNTIIEQPYKGRWNLSRTRASGNKVRIGVVNGDYVIGFTARDPRGNILGHYDTSEDALGAVVYVADIRDLEATWLLTGPS